MVWVRVVTPLGGVSAVGSEGVGGNVPGLGVDGEVFGEGFGYAAGGFGGVSGVVVEDLGGG